jgi:hypothetical protein
MQVIEQSAAPSGAWQWRRYALAFLALSAAVPLEVLEERNTQGRHRFVRGRHKYYGIGVLVIFFALFSGYGMGHMLATMSTISGWGAVLAGSIWAVFQWCLERQMLISIRADASIVQKLVGLTWRSMLALLSATTMVYPFFVESNRAEIDVHIGDMARARLIENQASAQLAVGLPLLREEGKQLHALLEQQENRLASDAPDLLAYKQKAASCWKAFRKQEQEINQRINRILLNATATALPSSDSEGSALRQKIIAAKALCQRADAQIMQRNVEWKQEQNKLKSGLLTQQNQLQTKLNVAKQKEDNLSQAQEQKISLAAQSGFAADFAAVAELVKQDANRRFQLIWWLVWFLAIEMVAILLKFTTTSDLDEYLQQEENWTRKQIEHEFTTLQEQLATLRLQASLSNKKEQENLESNLAQQMQTDLSLAQQIATHHKHTMMRLQGELDLNKEILNVSLQGVAQLQSLAQQAQEKKLDQRCETMIAASLEQLMNNIAGMRLRS